MVLKIHPGIGVARVGDSPESFIGPETVDLLPTPSAGYRDAEGRILRQAARFRLFEHTGGTYTHIVESATASIQWTVTLAGGTHSVGGVDQQAYVTSSGAHVAELRTDSEGNLLVLSYEVDASSPFDGTCEGPVEAVLTRAPAGATTATASWVCVVPPDFAPGRYPLLAYHYRILDVLHAAGAVTLPPATNLSFRRDIYPAIRGRTTHTPEQLLALATQPEREAAAPFNPPTLGSPEGDYLHAVVSHYHLGLFDHDWAVPTPLTPDELDRGPLSHCDASCPVDGWELSILALGASAIASGETLRLVSSPGTTVRYTGWRGDLGACVLEWPTVAGAPAGFGQDWQLRGFMVQETSGLEYREWFSRFELLTSHLDFGHVERGSTAMRHLDIELQGYFEPRPIVFSTPLPERISLSSTSSTTGVVPDRFPQTLSMPVFFTAELDAPLGDVPAATLSLTIDGQPRQVPVAAHIVPVQTTQVALVLDCSASMQESRGDGTSKFRGLQQAVTLLADVANVGDGIALAPFSDDPLPTLTARSLGASSSDPHRQAVRDFVDGLHTVDLTSIGDGILSARSLFGLTSDSFDNRALVVVTDGVETAPAWIRDVSSSIREDTFAIGIGTADNVDADILDTIAGRHNGYLMLTGNYLNTDRYRLEKFLLQVLTGATRDQVILDPSGSVTPGTVERIQIPLTEAEFRVDVVVVADEAAELVLALMGPDGAVCTFEALSSEPGTRVVRRPRVAMASIPLPFAMRDGRSWGPGTWYLLMAQRAQLRRGATESALAALLSERKVTPRIGKPLSYSAVVNARSSLHLHGHVARHDGNRPGFVIEAGVDYAGVPLRSAPSVVALVDSPRGQRIQVPLEASQPGRFFGRFDAVQPGVYSTRLRARGRSPQARAFVRELTLTASLSKGWSCATSCDAAAAREAEGGGPGAAAPWRSCRTQVARLLECLKSARRRC